MKLPSPVPTNPLEESRLEWIEAQGSSAFLESTVPKTDIRLTQIASQLIRTHHDYGTVTVLDTRLANGWLAPMRLKS